MDELDRIGLMALRAGISLCAGLRRGILDSETIVTDSASCIAPTEDHEVIIRLMIASSVFYHTLSGRIQAADYSIEHIREGVSDMFDILVQDAERKEGITAMAVMVYTEAMIIDGRVTESSYRDLLEVSHGRLREELVHCKV